MAEEDIWVSSVLNNSSLTVGTEINRDEPAWKAIEQGRDPLPEELPLRIYSRYRDETFEKKLPHLFFGAGGIKISPQLVSIFEQHDLGKKTMRPAQFFLNDRTTLANIQHSVFSTFEKRSFLLVDESKRLRGRTPNRHNPNPAPPEAWGMPYEMEDDDLAVMPASSNSLDLWCDTKTKGGLFFSDKLKQALCQEGFGRLFKFYRCRVLRMH